MVDNAYDHCVIENRIWGGGEKRELLLFSGNDGNNVSGPDRIRLKASRIVFNTGDNVGTDRDQDMPEHMVLDENGH